MITRSKGEKLAPLNLEIGKGRRRGQYATKTTSTSSTSSTTSSPVPSIPSTPPKSPTPPTSPMAQPPPPPQEESLRSFFKNLMERYEKDSWGHVREHNFQIHPSLVAMVEREQFIGFDTDDPNVHLIYFLDVCATIKPAGVSSDVVRMRMFGFSLIGAARTWYKSLDHEKVTTWREMCRLFLDKYFPASKAQELLDKIQMFEQYEDEPLHEAWTRFKELLNKCPDHGLKTGDIVVRFYKGLNLQTKKDLDFASKDGFLNGSATAALAVIEKMAETSLEWSLSRKAVKKKNMAVTSDAYDDLLLKLVKLQHENEGLKKGKFHVNDLEEESNAHLVEEVSYLQGNYKRGIKLTTPTATIPTSQTLTPTMLSKHLPDSWSRRSPRLKILSPIWLPI